MELSEEVKALRVRLNWTQKRMGEEMGFKNPQETIWDIEKGRVPRRERREIVRKFLDANRQEAGPAETPAQPSTIAEVLAWARRRVAQLAGVDIESVKLDLKLEG
jgi:transcriptional regulator with XRE-family HTH domain